MLKLRALVAKGHKNINAPLIFENMGYYFFWFWANYIMGHFSGYFEGASTFMTPKLSLAELGACIHIQFGALKNTDS